MVLVSPVQSKRSVFENFQRINLLGCDGTDSNIPADENDVDSFVSYGSKNGGYYQNHTVAVYDLLEKRYLDAIIQPRGTIDEQDACIQMVDRNPLVGSCLYVADRGFFGFNLIAHILEQHQFFLIRAKEVQAANSPFKDIFLPDIDEYDIPIEFVLSRSRKKQDQESNWKFLPSTHKFDFIPKDDFKSKYMMAFRLVRVCF